MQHADIWHAIECFAAEQGRTCSGLARYCGLDATIFNKSKRFSKYGQPRWLSFGTIAKILNGTNREFKDFIKFLPEYDKSKDQEQ